MNTPNPTYDATAALPDSIEGLTQALSSCNAMVHRVNEALDQSAPLSEICKLLSGFGGGASIQSIGTVGVNPDISGIGVSISFMVQGVFWVLFGPLLGVGFVLMPKRQSGSVKRHLKRLKDLSTIIRGTSAFLSFSTLLAGCIHLRQSPMPLETLYIVHLADYLSNMALGGLYISWSLKMGPLAKVPMNTIYLLCELTNKMLGDYLNNAARRELTPSLARQQVQLQPILAALQPQSSTQDESGLDSYNDIGSIWISNGPFSWVMWPIALGLALVISLLIFVVAMSDRPLLGMRSIPDIHILPLARRVLFNKTAASVFLLSMNILTLTLTLHSGWELWDARTKMNSLSGPSENNEWGFGQITAVLLWAPTTFWMIRNFLRLVPWMRIILFIAGKFTSNSEESSVMTIIVVAFVCAGISVELDRIDPLIKEPGEDYLAASRTEGRDEGFPDRRHQIRDVEDRPGLEGTQNHEDIEMSGALQSGDADEGARDGNGARNMETVDIARAEQRSNELNSAVEGSHRSLNEARGTNIHLLADNASASAREILQIMPEPIHRIARRHSN